jgi:hypothetical protein
VSRVFSTVVAALAMAVCASPAMASSDLVGNWQLDEGSGTHVTDSSGAGNSGVLSGAATWTTGHPGSALKFSGTGAADVAGEVDVPDSPSLEPASAVTVSAWVRADGSPGDYRYVVAKSETRCIAASYGLYTGPDGGLEFYVSKNRGTVYDRSPDAGTRVWDGQWHLAVGTFDGKTVRLFVDGTEIGSGTSHAGALEYGLTDGNDLFIGDYPSCANHGFIGTIDDVMIWSRALSSADVSSLMPSQGMPSQDTGGNPPGNPTPPAPTPSPGGSQPGKPGGTTPGTDNAQSRPSIHRLMLSRSTLIIGPNGHAARTGHATGLEITYTDNHAARSTLTVLRLESGMRKGKRCVKPPAHQTTRIARCVRFVAVGSFVHNDRAGHTTLHFTGLPHHTLAPGAYRLEITPRDHTGTGKTVSVAFVVRRSHA